MSKRINIVLSDKTVAVLDRVTAKGTRSQFIDRAVRHLVETESKANLRERLKAEAIENAERDLALATEWFLLEEEATTRLAERGSTRKPARKRA
jgi:metal-responsive CopG/Arc/MetJ family transcriptional regulator